MKRLGFKHVEGYQCLNCSEVIEDVVVKIDFQTVINIEDFTTTDYDIDNFTHIMDGPTFHCPECGYEFQ